MRTRHAGGPGAAVVGRIDTRCTQGALGVGWFGSRWSRGWIACSGSGLYGCTVWAAAERAVWLRT